jgi:hypothetical protein
VRAEGLRSAVVVLIVGAAVGLAVGSAMAETVAEPEAPGSADPGLRDSTPAAPAAEELGEQRASRYQRREEWWAHARAVLFSDIQLSAEQSRGVNEIITTQLAERRRSGELWAELKAIQPEADTERILAIRHEIRALRARHKGSHECIEEMRALLSEEQRPTFDTNRAHLAAERQQPQKKRRQRKRGAGSSTAHALAE